MSFSRKKLIAQIALMDRRVQEQKKQINADKKYFTQSRLNQIFIFGAILFIPILCLGWKLRGNKWVNKIALGLVDLVLVTAGTCIKRYIVHLNASKI